MTVSPWNNADLIANAFLTKVPEEEEEEDSRCFEPSQPLRVTSRLRGRRRRRRSTTTTATTTSSSSLYNITLYNPLQNDHKDESIIHFTPLAIEKKEKNKKNNKKTTTTTRDWEAMNEKAFISIPKPKEQAEQ